MTDTSYTPHGERHDEPKGGSRGRPVALLTAREQTTAHMTYGRATKNTTTLGWSDCGHDNYRPGHVCDPFAGTATTALAATQLGRDATCIDIDPRNIHLARHRIADNVHIHTEQGDGPVTTWTVEPALPGVKGEAEGQLSLFAP